MLRHLRSKWQRGLQSSVRVDEQRRALLPRIGSLLLGFGGGFQATQSLARTVEPVADAEFDIDLRLSPNSSESQGQIQLAEMRDGHREGRRDRMRDGGGGIRIGGSMGCDNPPDCASRSLVSCVLRDEKRKKGAARPKAIARTDWWRDCKVHVTIIC